MQNKENVFEFPDADLDGLGESLQRFGDSIELLQKVLDTIPQTVFWKDNDLNYLGCNQLFAQHAGRSRPAELIGLSDFDLPWNQEEAEFYRSCDRRVMESDKAEIGIVESQVNAEGKLTWLETNKVPLHNDAGEVIGILGTYHDITRLKEAEEVLQRNNEELERRVNERTRELKFVADHDVLTGLSSRRHFIQRLVHFLEGSSNENFALLFLDLDNFKPINDNDGHEAGDQLLIEVASILNSALGPKGFAGRLGGDEFLLLMRGLDSQDEAAQICNDVRQKLRRQVSVNGRRMVITASIGIVYGHAKNYSNCDDLINDSDLAMYAAKSQGKNNYCFFDESMRISASIKHNFEKQVIAGINNREFILHYQPIIDVVEGKVKSFEALVRWNHPERGLVFPIDFISVAESTGTIIQLGQLILESACMQLVKWKHQLGDAADELMVNINFSPRQLLEPNFTTDFFDTVDRFDVEPASLCLEITESLLLDNNQMAIGILNEVKRKGFKIYLDDFGTGYSSLNYLDELPVDALKIDRSFVDRFQANRQHNPVVQMILALADTLDVKAIAEGVENEFQLQVLQSMNCHLIQGYYFARPMLAEEATRYLFDFQCSKAT